MYCTIQDNLASTSSDRHEIKKNFKKNFQIHYINLFTTVSLIKSLTASAIKWIKKVHLVIRCSVLNVYSRLSLISELCKWTNNGQQKISI